jgi:hypothetical protein
VKDMTKVKDFMTLFIALVSFGAFYVKKMRASNVSFCCGGTPPQSANKKKVFFFSRDLSSVGWFQIKTVFVVVQSFEIGCGVQVDPIGRIFAYWVIVHLGYVFETCTYRSHRANFWGTFLVENVIYSF